MLLYNLVNRREHEHGDARARENVEKTLSKDGGFQLVMRERYLLLIAVMLTLANFTNTTGEYLFSNLVEIHAAEEVPDTAFPELAPDEQEKAVRKARGAVVTGIYGSYYGWVNILSLLIQAFVVSRIFKYLGVRAALFFLPVIVLGGYALVLIAPIFGVLRVAKLAENSTDYSLQNTVRQALFLPTSREAKYKAKAAIDTFFFRFGDTAAAFLIFAGIHWLHFSTSQYAAVCLAAGGLVTVTLLAREHKKLVPDDKRTELA
jgi:AAA family ATP:ADP antiporter